MSNVHVLESGPDGYKIALHLSIPVGTNSAGVAWQAAVLQYGGGKTILPATGAAPIASAELTQIQAGSVYEAVVAFSPEADFEALTGAQQTTLFNAWLTGAQTTVLNHLQQALKRFGYTQ